MNAYVTKMVPAVSSYINARSGKLIISVTLPDIKKDMIRFEFTENHFNLAAVKHNILYEVSLPLTREVIPDKARSEYKNGHLMIEVPIMGVRKNGTDAGRTALN